ncbi:kinesin family member 15 [Enteropsectra breve]|nr:kinesin family member 15 [Enteropsectra breve]
MHHKSMVNNIITYIKTKEKSPKTVYGGDSILVNSKKFVADAVLHGPDQSILFQSVQKNILEKCTQGYNCTIFAYGQTGSGKTYTIQGDSSSEGLVQRSLRFLHERYQSITMSFVEIYNENIIDQFCPANILSIREDPSTGVVVDNLSVLHSNNLEESLCYYKNGSANRKTSETEMNVNSSRSHSVLIVNLVNKENGIHSRSKLCFVDLAGSEKLRDGEAERKNETCNINKSLLYLGKIVQRLGTGDRGHVPYRDSKLTFLLKDSLSGNSFLAIIGNIDLQYTIETLNTLNFLQRIKMISNNPAVNYDIKKISVEVLTGRLQELENENAELKEKLHAMAEKEKNSGMSDLKRKFEILRKESQLSRELFANFRKAFDNLVFMYYDGNRDILREMNQKYLEAKKRRYEEIGELDIKRTNNEN